MRNVLATALAGAMLFGATASAQQKESYDYWQHQRRMVRYGQQAVFMCNGLFTSNRTLEQVFAQELAFLPEPVGTADGGDYEVDTDRKAVTIGNGHGTPKMRAAFPRGDRLRGPPARPDPRRRGRPADPGAAAASGRGGRDRLAGRPTRSRNRLCRPTSTRWRCRRPPTGRSTGSRRSR